MDEVQATELKYALGIPHIFCFEEWEAEQQKTPNKLIPRFAADDLWGSLSLADIRKIYTYKVDVLTGSMLGWEDYAYETFNAEKHCRTPFQAHHVGFYVGCFQCAECSKVDNKKCHAGYHVHWIKE